MTAAGRQVLQVLARQGAATVADVAAATGRCQRLTRAALNGCTVAGLADCAVHPAPPRYTITEAGRQALAE